MKSGVYTHFTLRSVASFAEADPPNTEFGRSKSAETPPFVSPRTDNSGNIRVEFGLFRFEYRLGVRPLDTLVSRNQSDWYTAVYMGCTGQIRISKTGD